VHIAKIREMSYILDENGYIVYQDEYQVVAEPFADLSL
jgi:hypothetical protein